MLWTSAASLRGGSEGETSMNLNDIMQAAQGGQGVNNLAAQFGLTPEQTQSAIQSMMPAFSMGLQKTAQDPSGLGGILSQLTSGAHDGSFTHPTPASPARGGSGGRRVRTL